MNKRILVLPQAERDIDEQINYLRQASYEAAARFCDAAENTFALITSHPEMGGAYRSDNPGLTGVRYFRVAGFEKILIFYRLNEDAVEVIRVLHRARNIEQLMD